MNKKKITIFLFFSVNLASLQAGDKSESKEKLATEESLYVQALANREAHSEANAPDLADVMNRLADIYRREQKYDAAEALFLRAQKIGENTSSSYSVAETLLGRGNLALDRGNTQEAETMFSKGISKLNEKSKDKLEKMILLRLYEGAIDVSERQKKYNEAISFLDKLCPSTLKAEVCFYDDGCNKHRAALLEKIGRKKEAKQVREEISKRQKGWFGSDQCDGP